MGDRLELLSVRKTCPDVDGNKSEACRYGKNRGLLDIAYVAIAFVGCLFNWFMIVDPAVRCF